MSEVELDVRGVFARHPVFARFRNEALDALLNATSLVRLRRGEPLWRVGERATHFTLVARGLVAVFAPCGPAREVLLGFASVGDGVGEAATLLGEARGDDAQAFASPTEVLRVPREMVMELLERSGVTALAYALRVAALRANADLRVRSLTQTSDARIAEVLLALASRFGEELSPGCVHIPMRLTRAQLASMVGTTVETAIRTVSKWSRDGIVSSRDTGMVVNDVPALAGIASVPLDGVGALASLTRIA